MKKPLLATKNLSKKFTEPTTRVLFDKIDLEIFPGETVAIVGQSGEGKTTLLHILGMLEAPCSGSIYIDGQEVSRLNKTNLLNSSIGFVFQGFHLLEDYTVMENILMPAKIGRKATAEAYKKAEGYLQKVGLGDKKNQLAKLLSGGEKQRVAIARALCNDPKLILADEPSGNLDEENSALIHSLLIDLAKKEGKAVVIVTHNAHLASLCDRTLTLKNKKLAL